MPQRRIVFWISSVLIALAQANGAAAAPATPTLAAPAEVVAGRTLSVTATTSTVGQTCLLLTTSPVGELRRVVVAGLRPRGTGARGRVQPSARPGTWSLQLQCGAQASRPVSIRVLQRGSAAGRAPRLVPAMTAYAFSDQRPSSLRTPSADQDGKGSPPFQAVAIDGVGASTGERAARALQWALQQVGRTDYSLWCLRFVANAYNAPKAGYPTAQAAADSLDLYGRGGSPASAPPGALVFFHVTGSKGENYGHVGLSLGDGRMVSAQDTVKIERIKDVPLWRTNYLGWAWPPAAWPGFPPPAPKPSTQRPQSEQPNPVDQPLPSGATPTPTPTPVAGDGTTKRIPITTDNRNTNGVVMVEDSFPLRLQTRPEAFCYSRGCIIPLTTDPGRYTGEIWDAAICQTRGQEMTNGSYGDPADDENPDLYTSNLWYGIQLRDGTFGYVAEVWIAAKDRGGLGLPDCPPLGPFQPLPLPAVPSGLEVGYAKQPLIIQADNRYAVGTTMEEDTFPVQLQTRPWRGCWSQGCIVPTAVDEGRFSGGRWSTTVCWTQGEYFSNAHPSLPVASDNPGLFSSRRWYGVKLDNGTLGYVNEAFIQAPYRGGLGLPYCPPYPDSLTTSS